MPVLHVTDRSDGQHLVLDLPAHQALQGLSGELSGDAIPDEIDAVIKVVRELDPEMPDQVMATCMALMGRLTEIKLFLARNENVERKLKVIRTQQLEPVMELIEFVYKASSRMVEIRRQEIELSRG